MWPFRNECSCFDGKQRLLLDLSNNQRATSQKSYFSQNLGPLTVIVRLLVIILLMIELRRSHLFRFFLWNLECIYRKILVMACTTWPILLLFATSTSPSSVFTFVVLLFLFLIAGISIRLMPALYISLRLHLAFLMLPLLTRRFIGLLVRMVVMLCVLRIFCFSDEVRLLLLRIRLDRL